MTTLAEPTVTPEVQESLAVVVKQNGLTINGAQDLIQPFLGICVEAGELAREAAKIKVTDATQCKAIERAGVMRKQLGAKRIEAEKVRKSLKEESLRKGKAIDGIANVVKGLIEPVETSLREMEEFAQRAEAKRIEELRIAREAELAPFGVDTQFYKLGEMPDESYAALLESSRFALASKVQSAKRAEEEYVAAEAARVAEDTRIREENARLKREAEAKEAQLRADRAKDEAEWAKANAERKAAEVAAMAERTKLEAAAKAEREAREKAEAELRTQQAAIAAKTKAEAEAKRVAERAPDKEKLLAFSTLLMQIEMPVGLSSAEARKIIADAHLSLMALSETIEEKAGLL